MPRWDHEITGAVTESEENTQDEGIQLSGELHRAETSEIHLSQELSAQVKSIMAALSGADRAALLDSAASPR